MEIKEAEALVKSLNYLIRNTTMESDELEDLIHRIEDFGFTVVKDNTGKSVLEK